MNFTKDQIKVLSAWEDNFRTAINASWARHPGRYALKMIYDVFTVATGDNRRFDANCQKCAVDLLRDCGRLYFQDKEEMAKKVVSKKEGNETEVKKVSVKVTRKKAVN